MVNMSMLISFSDDPDIAGPDTKFCSSPGDRPARSDSPGEMLVADKLVVPAPSGHMTRPRLESLLEKLLGQFGAALVLGRAGTGKTSLAAEFTRRYRTVSWFSIDSSDIEWSSFSRYFAAASGKECTALSAAMRPVVGFQQEFVSRFAESAAAIGDSEEGREDRLIVLDNTHNVFDAPWFNEFLTTLILSPRPSTRLLILARTLPPLPIWRLRSKQVLGFAGEKLLEFSTAEARKLFEWHGLNADAAPYAQRRSYGRASKLIEIIESRKARDANGDRRA